MSKTTPGYSMLVLAPFAPCGEHEGLRAFHAADWANALEAMGPRFSVPVDKSLCPEGSVHVSVSMMNHFSPRGMLRTVPYLSTLAEAASFLSQAVRSETDAAETARIFRERFGSLPVEVDACAASSVAGAGSADTAGTGLDDILAMASAPGAAACDPASPKAWLAKTMGLMGGVLNTILADPDYRRYEAAWRGFTAMSKEAAKAGLGKVGFRLGCIDEQHLEETLSRLAVDLRKDAPHLCLLDHEFTNSVSSMGKLAQVLNFADTLWLPTATSVGAGFFGAETLAAAASQLPSLPGRLAEPGHALWQNLRRHGSAGRVMLLANRFAVRPPWSGKEAPGTAGVVEAQTPWLSPVWGFGTVAAVSLLLTGWPTRFTDDENMHMEDLAITSNNSPTEIEVDDDLQRAFLACGITPVVGVEHEDRIVVPRESAMDGSSFSYALFFARVLGQLYLLSPENLTGNDPAEMARSVLDDLFVSTHVPTPEDLEISYADGALSVALSPPTKILGGPRISFSFKL